MEFLRRFFTDISDIICPNSCISCGCHLKAGKENFLCPNCWENYEKTDFSPDAENLIIQSFKSEGINIVHGYAFLKFDKKETTQKILHNIKYFRHPELGVKFGRIAALKLTELGVFKTVDYILPVPMHPEKQKKRGYNQAEKIAEGLSEVLNKPLKLGVLEKIKNIKSQTRMNKVQRRANSANAFKANRVGELSDKHFLIVDDVFTTGATLETCAKVLLEAMPECKISIFALAKA